MAHGIRQRPPGGSRGRKVARTTALNAMGSVVYAARLADGRIKIGCTEHFADRLRRLKSYVGQDIELIGFRFGTYDDEQALHAALADHRAPGPRSDHAREYYNPTPEVLAAVNAMRQALNLAPLAT